MSIGFVFWFLFFFFIILNGYWAMAPGWQYGVRGNAWLVVVLIFLLGWGEFGFIIQGGRGPF